MTIASEHNSRPETHAAQLGRGALGALSVVEFGEGTAAAYTAKLLADFGADVVKVERPQGDPTRRRGPFPDGKPDPDASGLFMYLNANKRGVVLDVEAGEGAEALDRLLKSVDIFVTDVAPNVLRAAGCDPEALRRRHPRLIVATLSPFGRGGPWSDWRGDELIAYAASGMAYGTPGIPDAAEDLDGEPPLHPSCFASETIAGASAAVAVMTAVTGRRHTGEGCHLDLSFQAASAAVQIRDLMPASYGSAVYNRLLNPTSIGRMPNFYLSCQDGYVTIAAPMDIHWNRLAEAMGNPEWARSADFATEPARARNWIELRERLATWAMGCTRAQLQSIGERYGLMMFPFHSIRQMAESDHARDRASLVDFSVGNRPAQMPGAPFKMAATPWSLRRPAPRFSPEDDAGIAPIGEVA
ncbi:CaiB/BaiF CoA transferase family protein [Aquibium oceanicum]|uniref:CaiB/BaiF CoA transferase family protein n=1 Tax=Aquibium oceanicum TaxID=1670800 RepID=UPI0009F9FAC2|nr:CoA transferase [Aquibium oceanicum]